MGCLTHIVRILSALNASIITHAVAREGTPNNFRGKPRNIFNAAMFVPCLASQRVFFPSFAKSYHKGSKPNR